MTSPARARPLARRAVSALTAAAYCGVAVWWLGSPLVEIPIPIAPTAVALVLIHVTVGALIGSYWAVALCTFPAIFSLLFPAALPADSDVPDYPALVATILIAAVLPLAAILVALGVALRRRLGLRSLPGSSF